MKIKIVYSQAPYSYEGIATKNYSTDLEINFTDEATLLDLISGIVEVAKVGGYSITPEILQEVIDDYNDLNF